LRRDFEPRAALNARLGGSVCTAFLRHFAPRPSFARERDRVFVSREPNVDAEFHQTTIAGQTGSAEEFALRLASTTTDATVTDLGLMRQEIRDALHEWRTQI
jgi:hypothetical protein